MCCFCCNDLKLLHICLHACCFLLILLLYALLLQHRRHQAADLSCIRPTGSAPITFTYPFKMMGFLDLAQMAFHTMECLQVTIFALGLGILRCCRCVT